LRMRFIASFILSVKIYGRDILHVACFCFLLDVNRG
jgi:hypothetical protein